jgi:hypothetical protein
MESQRILSILCDCSGSMHSMKAAMIESINDAFRHSADHFASGLLILFNSGNLKEIFVPDLSLFSLVDPLEIDCDNCSDLHDAIGAYLTEIVSGTRFPKETVHEVLIISDGADNSSKNFKKTAIRDLIMKARMSGQAEIYLMTTSPDFQRDADELGMNPDHAIHYTFTPEGLRHAILKGADFLLAKAS